MQLSSVSGVRWMLCCWTDNLGVWSFSQLWPANQNLWSMWAFCQPTHSLLLTSTFHLPIKLHPCRASSGTQVLLQQEVSKLLEHNVIEGSSSPWSASVVLVRKKDDTHCFCVDFCRLTAAAIKDSHPLPRVNYTLDSISGATIFSTIDLTACYLQITLNSVDKGKKQPFPRVQDNTNFAMAMGLPNALPSLPCLMELVLRGLHWSIWLIYWDDIVSIARISHTICSI